MQKEIVWKSAGGLFKNVKIVVSKECLMKLQVHHIIHKKQIKKSLIGMRTKMFCKMQSYKIPEKYLHHFFNWKEMTQIIKIKAEKRPQ